MSRRTWVSGGVSLTGEPRVGKCDMADSIKIDIPAGYAADYEKSPAGLNATRVVLTIWAVDGHQPWTMEVPVGLTPLQQSLQKMKRAWGSLRDRS